MLDAMQGARRLTEQVGVRVQPDAVLRVSGEDAHAWLSGQVTNEVRGLGPGQAVYALVLDARGKIVADAWVLERGQDLLLLVPAQRREALREHFRKYIVMEDVELTALDDVVLSAQGPRAGEAVERAGLESYPCDRLGIGGRDIVVALPDRERALAALLETSSALDGGAVDEGAWELARLRIGRPRYGVDFGPAQYPQEAGLRALAVSFDKGCYLGQEVVCTLENRGQLTRQLAALESAAELEPGTELTLGDTKVGHVTSSVHDPEASLTRALGYVKRAAAAPGTQLRAGDRTVIVRSVAGAPALAGPST